LSPTGKGSAQALAVTITGQVGTGAAAFTYNAPVVTRNNVQNAATTGYGSVIVEGTNFGPAVINEQDQVGRPNQSSRGVGVNRWTPACEVV
jgi:hypothetical protein